MRLPSGMQVLEAPSSGEPSSRATRKSCRSTSESFVDRPASATEVPRSGKPPVENSGATGSTVVSVRVKGSKRRVGSTELRSDRFSMVAYFKELKKSFRALSLPTGDDLEWLVDHGCKMSRSDLELLAPVVRQLVVEGLRQLRKEGKSSRDGIDNTKWRLLRLWFRFSGSVEVTPDLAEALWDSRLKLADRFLVDHVFNQPHWLEQTANSSVTKPAADLLRFYLDGGGDRERTIQHCLIHMALHHTAPKVSNGPKLMRALIEHAQSDSALKGIERMLNQPAWRERPAELSSLRTALERARGAHAEGNDLDSLLKQWRRQYGPKSDYIIKMYRSRGCTPATCSNAHGCVPLAVWNSSR